MNTPKSHSEIPGPSQAGSFPEVPGQGRLARASNGGLPAAVPDERRVLAFAGEVRRVGRWIAPRLLRVRALLGEVRVDLRETTIPPDFTLDVRAYGSRVTLIVPPEVTVAFDVFAVLGNAINQADEQTTSDQGPFTIRVTGSAVMGEVRVLVRDRPARSDTTSRAGPG